MNLRTCLTAVAFATSALTFAQTPAANSASSPTSPSPANAWPAKPGKYHNFAVSIYIPVGVVRTFGEAGRLEREWNEISANLKVDKVYIESHRGREVASDALLDTVKNFFVSHGVRVAGGITFADKSVNGQYISFCYTDPNDREYVKGISELTARHFDEIILDDFFFVTTKRPSDIEAKGNRSWTDFRLELMDNAGRDLVVNAAKAVNPKAHVIVKYPNWYEHFAGLGFDLDKEPKIFDGIYTGTETRDPNNTDQYLQQYESYQVVRYFENIAPGRNGGGWVDSYAINYLDRYAEQLWDTVLAKAPEMTLFEWSGLLHPAAPGDRKTWADGATSFKYDAMTAYHPEGANAAGGQATFARVAGYALDQIDPVIGKLGKPIGVKSYRPPHATGDDFLHNFIGMIGVPIDLYPTFPEDGDVVLLTESARSDPQIVAKIKKHLLDGRSVVVTESLYKALQGHGIEDIVEMEATDRRILADGYALGYGAGSATRDSLKNEITGAPPILFPQLRFLTNDAWALASAMSDGTGYPLLVLDRYGKDGLFYVWTMPDNFHHLYELPPPVTSAIKDVVMQGFPVRLDGPSEIALFAYDNDTFVVQSYRGEAADVKIGTLGRKARLHDLVSGEYIDGTKPPATKFSRRDQAEHRATFDVHVEAHSHRAFELVP